MSITTTIDASGRLILPKAVREKLNFRAGTRIQVSIVGDKAELSQEEREVALAWRGKRRVVVGWEGF